MDGDYDYDYYSLPREVQEAEATLCITKPTRSEQGMSQAFRFLAAKSHENSKKKDGSGVIFQDLGNARDLLRKAAEDNNGILKTIWKHAEDAAEAQRKEYETQKWKEILAESGPPPEKVKTPTVRPEKIKTGVRDGKSATPHKTSRADGRRKPVQKSGGFSLFRSGAKGQKKESHRNGHHSTHSTQNSHTHETGKEKERSKQQQVIRYKDNDHTTEHSSRTDKGRYKSEAKNPDAKEQAKRKKEEEMRKKELEERMRREEDEKRKVRLEKIMIEYDTGVAQGLKGHIARQHEKTYVTASKKEETHAPAEDAYAQEQRTSEGWKTEQEENSGLESEPGRRRERRNSAEREREERREERREREKREKRERREKRRKERRERKERRKKSGRDSDTITGSSSSYTNHTGLDSRYFSKFDDKRVAYDRESLRERRVQVPHNAQQYTATDRG